MSATGILRFVLDRTGWASAGRRGIGVTSAERPAPAQPGPPTALGGPLGRLQAACGYVVERVTPPRLRRLPFPDCVGQVGHPLCRLRADRLQGHAARFVNRPAHRGCRRCPGKQPRPPGSLYALQWLTDHIAAPEMPLPNLQLWLGTRTVAGVGV